MSRPDEHVPFEELAVGHALSALEPEEEQRFLQHLAGCARCERDVAEHQATMGHLAYAPDPADPPPSLLEGIRAGVQASGRTAAHPPRLAAPQDAAAPQDPAAPQDAVVPSAGDELATRRRRLDMGRPARWTAAAAAATLVVSLGAWNVALRSDRDASQERGTRLAEAVRELGRPGTEAVPLSSDEGKVVAVAMVHDRQMSLVVDGLAPNAPDSTYVLWAQAPEGDVRPVGAFDVARRDLDVVQGMQVQEGLDGITALMVSREPGDVAPPAPGGPVLATGEA